jgi:D-serine deaminase-like pyridoxal phosphate-dependent protein
MTHAGHSYACPTTEAAADLAEHERSVAVRAAGRLRALGLDAAIVSVGSTPTALHARHLTGVTETRPGVYMFQDLFQTQIGSGTRDDIAVTVLASVTGRRPAEGKLVIDAGGLALSKDRSTAAAPRDYGFGLVLDIAGVPLAAEAVVERANQEHGVIAAPAGLDTARFPVGTRLRIAPNHVCMMAAMYDRYHVVDGGETVVAVWDRVNGW